jgi:hypothetical protein
MAITFSLSYLFSVLGAFSFVAMYRYNRNIITYSILSIGFITLSLGLYQANLGCTLILLSLVLIKNLWQLQKESIWNYLKKIIHAIVMIGCACILYAVIWKIFLSLMHTQKSTYHGAASISVVSILSSLPRSIHAAYTAFLQYFMPGQWQNIYQQKYIFLFIVFALFTIITIYSIVHKAKWSNKILSLICIALLPLFANVCLLLAPDADGMQLQMTMPMAMILPGLIAMIDSINIQDNHLKLIKLLFFAFGNVMMVSTDQHVMLQSKIQALH